MKKDEFLDQFRQGKITIWFNDAAFREDDNIDITEEVVSSEVIKNFHVLRSQKDGVLDHRSIEKRIYDSTSSLVTVNKVAKSPKEWDLELGERVLPEFKNITNIPVATDIESGKTLILDSNHCLANLINQATDDFTIPIVRLKGKHLERIIIDFYILNRQ